MEPIRLERILALGVPLMPLFAAALVAVYGRALACRCHVLVAVALGISAAANAWLFAAVWKRGVWVVDFAGWALFDWGGAGAGGLRFVLDPLSMGAAAVVCTAALLSQVYAASLKSGRGEGAAAAGLLSGGVLLAVWAGEALVFWIGLEVAGIGAYFCHLAFSAGQRGRMYWGLQRLAVTAFVGALLLLPADVSAGADWTSWGAALLAVAVLALLGQVPLTAGWEAERGVGVMVLVQGAYVYALGGYGLLRWAPAFSGDGLAGIWAWGGMAVVLAGSALSLWAVDLRRALAYLGIGQFGYTAVAVGLGWPAHGAFHLLFAVGAVASLVLGAGRVVRVWGGRSVLGGGGVGGHLPLTFWLFLLGTLSLAGTPPLAGFWSQGQILMMAYETGAMGVWAAACAGLLLGTVSAFRLFCLLFVGPAHRDATRPLQEWPLVPLGLLAPLAVLPFVGSLWGYPMGAGAFVRAVAGQWPQTAAMGGALGPLELTAITVGIVGVGLLLTWSFYGAGKLPWVGPAALARGGWVERHAVQGVAGWILWGGRLLFVWVEALAADLALGTGVQAGVKGLGRWLDRGQRRFEKKGPWIAVCGVGMLLGSLFWMRG